MKASLLGATAKIKLSAAFSNVPVCSEEKGFLTANQTSQLKNEDGQHEDPFHGKVLVATPPHRLGGSNREEHSGAIPADIVEAVKLTSDAWNRCGDDGLEMWVTVVSLYCLSLLPFNVFFMRQRH